MGFELNDRVMGLNVQLQAFMDKHIYPREHDWHEWCLDQDNLSTRHGVPGSAMSKSHPCSRP